MNSIDSLVMPCLDEANMAATATQMATKLAGYCVSEWGDGS